MKWRALRTLSVSSAAEPSLPRGKKSWIPNQACVVQHSARIPEVYRILSHVVELPTGQVDLRQAMALATFAGRLAAGTNVQDVVRAVAESAASVVDALRCTLALWDPRRDMLVAPVWQRHDFRTRLPGSSGPEAGLFTVRPPAHTVSAVLGVLRAPDRGPRRRGERRIATATFALYDPPGDVYAALELIWAGSPCLDPTDVALLNMMADLTGTALRRALDNEVHEDVARALSRPLPAVTPRRGGEESAREVPSVAFRQGTRSADGGTVSPVGPSPPHAPVPVHVDPK